MGARAMSELKPLHEKAAIAVLEEFERQAAERPEKLSVHKNGSSILVHGEVDIDALVMVVVGSMAGGP